ncbi:hypothetical protein [Nitrospirillum viridazoti]|uniref:Tail tube protein n=1 Tax=Nitrospirillum amazonense TaxID=28077 RepID=A0A560IPV2_9PROT|nr:hypothetical protein [Nitrospirillum amazonense]TWB58680.1 hypothetical protein FBZ92_109173 [Nitrospirillum amazonense]
MAIRHFGSGTLFGLRTDTPNATPIMFGALQDVQVDISGSNKELYGEGQVAIGMARGQVKITGKAKQANISPIVMSDLFFGVPLVSGQTAAAVKEAAAVPGATTYTVTVGNGATFAQDLGVVYTNTALPLKKVAANPTVGQYSVGAGGVYTFAAADAGVPVGISYTYTVANTGQKLTVMNPDQGVQPVFSMILNTSYPSPSGIKRSSLTLFANVSEKLSFATKNGDWMIPEFDFSTFADDGGRVMEWSFPELS